MRLPSYTQHAKPFPEALCILQGRPGPAKNVDFWVHPLLKEQGHYEERNALGLQDGTTTTPPEGFYGYDATGTQELADSRNCFDRKIAKRHIPKWSQGCDHRKSVLDGLLLFIVQ
jgi:hypothetical protein